MNKFAIKRDMKNENRNYSLDLLRIISMFMIVFLHSNSHGGLFYVPDTGFDRYVLFAWFIECMCIGAVNLFVLISGYFLCEQKFHLSRVVRLILQTLFYSWIIGAVLIAVGKMPLLSIDTISSILPISFRNYWFISAYIGVYLISPILNKMLKSFSKQQHLTTVLLLVVMMALWSDVVPLSDPFVVERGYGLTWFVVLYIVAAYIRKYVDITKMRHTLAVYLGMSMLLLLIMLVLYFVSQKIPLLANYSIYSYYSRYNSTIVLASSVALFLTFLKLRLQADWLVKIVKTVAPLTLGVYLIHDNPNMRSILWRDCFPLSSFERNMLLPFISIGAVLLIFSICIAIDFIRLKLFLLLESSSWYKKLMNKVDESVFLIYHKFFNKMED